MRLPQVRVTLGATLVLVALMSGRAELSHADEADDLFDKGNAAYDAGKYEIALEHFAAVWKLRRTHDLAATMAQAEMKLERHAAAAAHLKYALDHFPLTGKTETKKRMEMMLAEAKTRATVVNVQTNVNDVTISIDGAVVDGSFGSGELFLSPGPHRIGASARGYQTAQKTIQAKAGGTETVALTLMPAAANVPMATASPTATTPPTRSKVPAYVMGGVGLGSFVIGGALIGVAEAKRSEARGLAASPDGRCVVDTAPQTDKCMKIGRLSSDINTLGNTGIGLSIGGGLLVIGAALYALWPTRMPLSAVRILPIADAGTGGLIVTGAF